MKFKKTKYADSKTLIDTHELTIQTREDGKPGLFIATEAEGVYLKRAKALKLAWAILDELDPDGLG